MSESKEIKLKGRPKKNTDKEGYKNTVFCNRLNTLFYNKKESQEAAAKVFNTSRQTFGNWLAGRNQPDFETLIKIAKYYNVSTDYLLGITNVSSIDNEVRTAVEVTGLSEKAVNSLKALTTSEKGVSEVIEAILKNKYFEEAILDIIHLLTYPTDKPENYFEFEGHSIETKKFLRSSVNDELSSLGHNLLTDEKLKGVLNNG